MKSSPLLLPFCLLLLVAADDDCLQFTQGQYTTIVECDHGCQYEFHTKDSRQLRLSGGCSNRQPSRDRECTTKNDRTICSCRGDRCNEVGYDMPSQ